MRRLGYLKFKVNSEIGKLGAVILHKPGKELQRLRPKNLKDFLYEDIPYLDFIQEEYDNFSKLIKEKTNAKIFYVQKLLEEVLKNTEAKSDLLQEIRLCENCPALTPENFWDSYTEKDIAEILIMGLTTSEWLDEFEPGNLDNVGSPTIEDFVIKPCPNFIFTRDASSIISNQIVIGSMRYDIRSNEPLIMRHIFRNHPKFQENQVVFGNNELEMSPHSIEGGDIIVLNDHTIAIGNSQRTLQTTIKLFSKNVFNKTSIDTIYCVEIPQERAYMHLDTVFTVVDVDTIVAYPDAFNAGLRTTMYKPGRIKNEIIPLRKPVGGSFLEALANEIENIQIINTGGGEGANAEIEQWCDATNSFALSPGNVISYERNRFTNEALENAGINVHTIRGSELTRGRGGARCMTLPLLRSD